jgi:6-pyruvoyltetrahydropterin/6-carboxytetrahydropterin synthase
MSEFRTTVTQAFTFHAAHVLPWHPGKCSQLHGHTYRVEVWIEGDLNENGIVVDFDEVLAVVQGSIIDRLDHTLLNDVIPNPTAELVALHIMGLMDTHGLSASQVRVWETPDSSAVVTR